MKKTIILVCLAVIIRTTCSAQINNSQAITNWGQSVNGVQLSIALSNNIINVGSIKIQARIQNLSTNVVSLMEASPVSDFGVFLINSSGNKFRLSPPEPLKGSRVPIMLEPEETLDRTIPVTVGSEFTPGKYLLKASRKFETNGKWLEMQSNSLKVQIK